MVCNPSLNNITCPPNLISDPFTSIPSCPNFSGWSAAGGTPDYFTGDIECGNPAFCIQTPIDPSMIGFRTYSDFPCNTPQTPYTEAVQGIVSVAPNQPYIFSFFRTIEPQEPETTQNPGNLQLENLSVFLTDVFTYVPMGLTINCLPIPANNTPQRFDVYAEANIAQVAWRQGLACFTIPPGGSNYSRLAFMGYENSGRMFTLIDRVDIIEDHFPFGVHNLTTDCLSPLTIGDSQTCGTVPNLTYQWQMSLDGINWTNIAGANQPTYQVPAITVTTWYRLNRFMNTSAPVYAPLANPSMANCVTASAIYVITPVGTACCILATANTYFAQPNGSPHFTVTSSQTWQPGAGNHPFTGFEGTAANPIRINGTITVNPSLAVSMQNLNFEFGPNGRIVIEPTASMTISGCTLTGDPVCQTMWQGIRVVGSGYNIIPDVSNAGFLHIETASVLHALIGAANIRLPVFNLNSIATITDSGSGVYPFVNFTSQAFPQIWSSDAMLSSGGIITTNNAQFVNCFQDINLSWQNKPATTTVSNCAFSHNTALSANGALWYPFNTVAQTETGIFVLNYRHVTNIQQCTFNHIKYGIRSNACFSLQVQNNAFNQCEIGVSARKYGTSMSSASYILSNNFEDNYIAIQTDGDNSRIYLNNINRQNPNPLSYRWSNGDVTVGILLRASSFRVGDYSLENYIDNIAFGVLPISNFSMGGRILNNQLTNSSASVFALGNNRNVAINCNNLHNYQLFGLGLAAWNTENGVLSQQGHCASDNPAGNSFIPAAPIVYTDLWRDVPNSEGFVYEDINTTGLNLPPSGPIPGITLNECSSFNPEEIDDLCAGLLGIRSREEIIAEPDETKRNQEGYQLMETYLAAGDTTEALQLLQDLNTKESMRLLSSEHIGRNQVSLAENILNNLPRQTQEDEDFYRLQNVLLDLIANEQDIFDINPAQEDTLLAIAGNHTHTAYLAQSLLYAAKGHKFPLELPQIEGLQGNSYTAFKAGNNLPDVFTVYPNPATIEANFKYQVPQNKTARFTLYDLSGRVLSIANLTGSGLYRLNTLPFKSGIYYYTVTINGVFAKRHKLVIIN